ncbi:hypothetical protein GC722_00040 [Auraticoccus sp. F435]|uniref:Nuclear transport factor 2 family protein n=1 Tax=Auraticoccus cholistanensis TaxID=2656650 RepID=A0A6A9UZX4_9ACTN|nr:hypothetical protein [Auraticoccus cholistanensis]MVA74430.1 hypothetical protein [Auraticoccus cholistanensis]
MRRQLAAVSLLLLLPIAACRSEPEPAPTAVLPTPAPPTAQSPTPEERESEAVLRAYNEGQQVAEDLFQQGGDLDAEETLAPYFSGPLLDFYTRELARFRRDGLTLDGPMTWKATVTDPPASPDDNTARITSCADYSRQRVLEKDGETFDRGFDYSVDAIDMRKVDGIWKTHNGRSEPSVSRRPPQCS